MKKRGKRNEGIIMVKETLIYWKFMHAYNYRLKLFQQNLKLINLRLFTIWSKLM